MIRIECDKNGCRNKGFEVFYCEDCFADIERQLGEANDRVRELEKEIEELRRGAK